MLRHALLPLVVSTGCFQMMAPAAYQPADPAQIKEQQRQGMAQSLGYPTRKTEADLDRTIAEQTAKYKRTGRGGSMTLQSPEPFTFDGVAGTCYTVVMRLDGDAKWDIAGDYTKFDFQRPETRGSGGPGVVGPGAIASVGCAKTSGPITLTMASMIDGDRIGFGTAKLELYNRVLTRAERKAMEEEERRQIEQQELARQERERQERRRQEDEQRRRDREREEASRPRYGSSSGGSSSGSSGPVSVTIRSSCSRTVKVFYGSNPKFGSGTQSSISSNSVQSKSFRVGDMFWVTDESGNGLDSVTVSDRTRGVEIGSSCSDLYER